MLRLGILGSTKGTDLEAIISAIQNKSLNAEISVVVSNKETAFLLKRAEKNDIKNTFISDRSMDREKYGDLLTQEFKKKSVNIVLLIGFMRILSKSF